MNEKTVRSLVITKDGPAGQQDTVARSLQRSLGFPTLIQVLSTGQWHGF